MAIDAAETLALTQPQVGCEVIHRFGPGLYFREVIIPAGVFVTGYFHRFPHANIMLAGAISMRENDGEIHVVRAPHFYISGPGRKMGLALERVVWQNVYSTHETDIEQLERNLFLKSPEFVAAANQSHAHAAAAREADRQDFHMVLDEYGLTPFEARELSERADDLIPMPADAGANVVIRRSAIEGHGVFVQANTAPWDILAPARIGGKRTPAGRYANHSRTPNAMFVERNGDAYLVATAPIRGYTNENIPGDEVTVDYRQALSLAGRLR